MLQVYKQDQYLYVSYYRVGNVSPGCDSSAAYGQQKPAGMSKFIPFRYNLDKIVMKQYFLDPLCYLEGHVGQFVW